MYSRIYYFNLNIFNFHAIISHKIIYCKYHHQIIFTLCIPSPNLSTSMGLALAFFFSFHNLLHSFKTSACETLLPLLSLPTSNLFLTICEFCFTNKLNLDGSRFFFGFKFSLSTFLVAGTSISINLFLHLPQQCRFKSTLRL